MSPLSTEARDWSVEAGHNAITTFDGPHRFLSNFSALVRPVSFRHLGATHVVGSTLEHAFAASKARTPNHVLHVLGQPTPGRAKAAGRKVPLRDDWEDVKVRVMEDLLRQKFDHPELAAQLVATYPSWLIEGNTWGDRFWGVDLEDMVGANVLGQLLMARREVALMHARSGRD